MATAHSLILVSEIPNEEGRQIVRRTGFAEALIVCVCPGAYVRVMYGYIVNQLTACALLGTHFGQFARENFKDLIEVIVPRANSILSATL